MSNTGTPTDPTSIAAAHAELKANEQIISKLAEQIAKDNPNAPPPITPKVIVASETGSVDAGAEGIADAMIETMRQFGFGTVDPASGVSPEQVLADVKDILDGKPVDRKIIEEARIKLAALNNSAEWVAKVLSGDPRANHESMMLNLYATIAKAKPEAE